MRKRADLITAIRIIDDVRSYYLIHADVLRGRASASDLSFTEKRSLENGADGAMAVREKLLIPRNIIAADLVDLQQWIIAKNRREAGARHREKF